MLEKSTLKNFIQNPEKITAEHAKELHDTLQKYPFFAWGHTLLAHFSKENDKKKHAENLQVASIYNYSRGALRQFLKKNVHHVDEQPLKVEDIIGDKKAEKIDEIQEEKSFFDNFLNEDFLNNNAETEKPKEDDFFTHLDPNATPKEEPIYEYSIINEGKAVGFYYEGKIPNAILMYRKLAQIYPEKYTYYKEQLVDMLGDKVYSFKQEIKNFDLPLTQKEEDIILGKEISEKTETPIVEIAKVETETPIIEIAKVETETPIIEIAKVETETPIIEIAKVETETPIVEIAKVETETPIVEIAKVETETPIVEIAKVETETPIVEIAKVETETPIVEIAKVETETPIVEIAKVETETPIIEIAKVETETPIINIQKTEDIPNLDEYFYMIEESALKAFLKGDKKEALRLYEDLKIQNQNRTKYYNAQMDAIILNPSLERHPIKNIYFDHTRSNEWTEELAIKLYTHERSAEAIFIYEKLIEINPKKASYYRAQMGIISQ